MLISASRNDGVIEIGEELQSIMPVSVPKAIDPKIDPLEQLT